MYVCGSDLLDISRWVGAENGGYRVPDKYEKWHSFPGRKFGYGGLID